MASDTLADYLYTEPSPPWSVFKARQISEPIKVTYSLLTIAARDRCDTLTYTDEAISWWRDGRRVGRYLLADPAPAVGWPETLRLILAHDAGVRRFVESTPPTAEGTTFRIRQQPLADPAPSPAGGASAPPAAPSAWLPRRTAWRLVGPVRGYELAALRLAQDSDIARHPNWPEEALLAQQGLACWAGCWVARCDPALYVAPALPDDPADVGEWTAEELLTQAEALLDTCQQYVARRPDLLASPLRVGEHQPHRALADDEEALPPPIWFTGQGLPESAFVKLDRNEFEAFWREGDELLAIWLAGPIDYGERYAVDFWQDLTRDYAGGYRGPFVLISRQGVVMAVVRTAGGGAFPEPGMPGFLPIVLPPSGPGQQHGHST